MTELIPITLTSIVLSLLYHRASEYDPIRCRYGRKDFVFYAILSVAMILFCGLRTGYNDTGTYQYIYNSIPHNTDIMRGVNWLKLGENPGFTFTNNVLVRLGFSTQSYLMFYAVITVGLNLWFFRKYSRNFPVSIFLFVAYAGYIFTLAAIKQCVAMALCLLATDRAFRKQWIPFVFWVLVASTYHPYALMYLIVPFLMFRPWSGRTYLMLLVFAVVGVAMQSLLGTVLSITDMLGENYDASSFSGEGINPFRLAVTSVPVLVSFVTRQVILQEDDPEQNLMLNLTILNAEIMFIALFGTANYFGRLANYFLPFQAVSLPWLFTHFEPRSKRFITSVAMVCYGLYLVYSQMFHESFDHHFYSTTLLEYLKSLLLG